MSAVVNVWRLLLKAASRDRSAMRRRLDGMRARVRSTGSALGISSANVLRQLFRVLAAEGMIHPDECLLLMELAACVPDGAIVEIGSYRGRSTIALAIGSSHGARAPVFAIEPHATFTGLFGANFGPADRVAFFSNISRARVADIVHLVNLPSEAAAASWTRPIGLLWIDGDHRYDSVRRDFETWTKHLLPGGRICLDDSTRPGDGPYQLIQELVKAGTHEIVDTVGKVTVLRPRPMAAA